VVVGQQTEKKYFEDFKGPECPSPSITVNSAPKNPSRQVEIAKGLSPRDFDEIWVVFDVDHFELSDIENAISTALDAGFRVAVSNPCFEYWLILHYEPYSRFFDSPKKTAAYLRDNHVPGYSKNNPCVEKFRDKHKIAIDNAKQRVKVAADHHSNPYTGVWELVEIIIEEQSKTRRK
jgi:hypothetical protein